MLNKRLELLNLLSHLKRDDSEATVIGRLDKKIFSNAMSSIRVERYDKEIQKLCNRREKVNKALEKIMNNITRHEQREEGVNSIILLETHTMKLNELHNNLLSEIDVLEKRRQILINKILFPLVDKGAYSFMAAPFAKEILSEVDGMETLDFRGCAKLIEIGSNSFFDSFSAVIDSINELNNIVASKSQGASEIFGQVTDISKDKGAKKELIDVRRKLAFLRKELAEKEIELREIEGDIERVKAEKDKLEIALDDTERLLLYKAYAERIYKDFLFED